MSKKIPIEIFLAIIFLLVLKLATMFWAGGHDEVVGNEPNVNENKTIETTTTTSTIITTSTTSLLK